MSIPAIVPSVCSNSGFPLCLGYSFIDIHMPCSFTSFRFLFKCHHFSEHLMNILFKISNAIPSCLTTIAYFSLVYCLSHQENASSKNAEMQILFPIVCASLLLPSSPFLSPPILSPPLLWMWGKHSTMYSLNKCLLNEIIRCLFSKKLSQSLKSLIPVWLYHIYLIKYTQIL